MLALAVEGATVVVSTHDLTEAERLPQIIVYRDSCAGAQTTPAAEIAASGGVSLEAALLAEAQR